MSTKEIWKRNNTHYLKHKDKQPDLKSNPACPLCHPLTKETSTKFAKFYNWFDSELQVAQEYNQLTFDEFEKADLVRKQLQTVKKIIEETKGVLKSYRRVVETIKF